MEYMHDTMIPLLALTFLLLLLFTGLCNADIISNKSDSNSRYVYDYYYDNTTTTSCDSFVMINVGTAMKTEDYSKLATSIVTFDSNTIAIIVDSNPNCITCIKKDNGIKFANVVNAVVRTIPTLVPKCTTTMTSKKPPLYIVGGHSGGGKGAINAINLKLIQFPIAGFVGLDPFEIKPEESNLSIDIPSLHWGFNETSCRVIKENAAMASYNISNTKYRIMYRVNTPQPTTILSGPHCSFSNHGCVIGMCPGSKDVPWIRTQVAITIHYFVTAIQSNNNNNIFQDRNHFMINETDAILIMNDETIPK